jgi:HSP20 family protein
MFCPPPLPYWRPPRFPATGNPDPHRLLAEDCLIVRGSGEEKQEQKNGGTRRIERYAGSFARPITLPPYVDAENVQAKYDKGVLTVTVPKVAGKGPKKVEVKAGPEQGPGKSPEK